MAEQKVALVTGSAGGLGREVGRQLVAAGIHVIISARRPEAAAVAAADIGATALSVGLDVSSAESVAAAVRELEAGPGRLDILVNNAAAAATRRGW
ncbi:SDR family NAD(P)-dependent oxidoreductase [Oryzobacter terrae]|uniref:SDR family NAD(P)-dependent oxidoreductase n=1 Tax=Oryzobacter terrae TaxID=1620385 RepID=UPI0036708131